jgi:hypothetical protein
MLGNDKQAGRTRVNVVSDRKKTCKPHVQHKRNGQTSGLDKLYQLQDEFFKDCMGSSDYKDYVQDKINNDMYYYKNLSRDDFDKLKKRYSRMGQSKKNNLNLTLSERTRKKRQKKLFKAKKSDMICRQKRVLIEGLFKEISKSKTLGLTSSAQWLSSNPDDWNNTKNLLFSGGRYLEKADKEWANYYQKIVSGNSAHLFNINSADDLNQYVMDHCGNKEENIVEEVNDVVEEEVTA